jgi:hypothetical protein
LLVRGRIEAGAGALAWLRLGQRCACVAAASGRGEARHGGGTRLGSGVCGAASGWEGALGGRGGRSRRPARGRARAHARRGGGERRGGRRARWRGAVGRGRCGEGGTGGGRPLVCPPDSRRKT